MTSLAKEFPASNIQDDIYNSERLFFIENKGQWSADVLFLCRMNGLDAWITKKGVNYTFYKRDIAFLQRNLNCHFDKIEDENKSTSIIGHRVLFELHGTSEIFFSEGLNKQNGYYNYLIGDDFSKHTSFVSLYKEVLVKNVYDGIDIHYYFDRGRIRFDFLVAPNVDPSLICFSLSGQYSDYIANDNIEFTTRFGKVSLADLTTFQDKKKIKSSFRKSEEKYRIELSSYDRSRQIIIDPLIYSTFIGGSGDDWGRDIAVDKNGNTYVTGYTWSSDYDVTPGVFQILYGGGMWDVFVTKLNPSATALIYSTYIGGSNGEEHAFSIAIDNAGNSFITGYVASSSFPTTPGAYSPSPNGDYDAFVTKLNSAGSALVFSTFLGGSEDDRGKALAIDNIGNVYVIGYTNSTDFPVSIGAFQSTLGVNHDVFVSKLNSTGTSLQYSTYIGGSGTDMGWGGIAVDSIGNAFVSGYTFSSDFPVTPGAFQSVNNGLNDAFVLKLNSSGTGLLYSTYIGGIAEEWAWGRILVDNNGHALVTGNTSSTNFPVSPSAFQTTSGGGIDAFVLKLNANGTGLLFSSYLGGGGEDDPTDVVIDQVGNVIVVGLTTSFNFPITPGAFQLTKGQSEDAFVCKINSTGTSLIYSTFLGGNDGDIAHGVAADSTGNIYVAGFTMSSDFPVTTGVYQSTLAGFKDVFVTKFDFSTVSIIENSLLFQDWHFYPNPNSGIFTIICRNPANFELTDITGKKIREYQVTNTSLNVSENIQSGLYFLRKTGSNEVYKIIVQ